MAFEKIILLWQQSWYSLTRTPLNRWLEVLFLHLKRLYYFLVTTYAIFMVAAYCIAIYFFKNYLFFTISTLFLVSCYVYLIRPTIGLKRFSYLKNFFSLENSTSVFVLVFFYTVLAVLMPTSIFGPIVLAAVCTFSFLYDSVGNIPDKVGYALGRTVYFMLYKAPLVFFLMLFALGASMFNGMFVARMFNALVSYPLFIALFTVLYVTVLHDNYELYYDE